MESEPGEGTKVSTRAEEKKSVSSSIQGSETILMVGDGGILRGLLKRILERLGYTVLVAPHGGEALLIAESHEGMIDLMITHLVLPQMGGHDIVERLMPSRPEMSVLYMLGYDEEMGDDQGPADVEKGFLKKPFDFKALGKKIREILDKPPSAH